MHNIYQDIKSRKNLILPQLLYEDGRMKDVSVHYEHKMEKVKEYILFSFERLPKNTKIPKISINEREITDGGQL